jgi:dephospho-CoA kinase
MGSRHYHKRAATNIGIIYIMTKQIKLGSSHLIGVTGPSGAGKDSSANYLAELLNLPHISGSEIIKNMLLAAGLPVTKSSVRNFSIFLRAQFGPDVIINRVLSLAKTSGLITSGFRTYAEAQIIKDRGGIIIYVDASEGTRYQRVATRNREGDPLTNAKFMEIDRRERNGSTASDENLSKIKDIADIVIENEGTVEELQSKLKNLR